VGVELREVFDRELAALPEKYRAAVVLCSLQGKNYREAAGDLGCAEGTVASRLARGRALLARRLARHGLAPSVGLATVLSLKVTLAGVPTSVVSATVKAATLFAAGQAAAGVLSVKVVALTEGVLKTMLLNKLKVGTGVLLVAILLIGIGTAVVLGQQPDRSKETDPEAKQAEAKAAAEKALLGRLQGTWKCVSMQSGGVKSEPDLTHTIKGNTWQSRLDGRVIQSGTFKLVGLDASPKQIDSLTTFAEAEVVGERKGKTCVGIFMLDGDSLFTCVSDDRRPKVFFTQEGDGCTAAQFQRVASK
jgi:uncharacterized protein (TIGR03067 family)